MIIAVACDHAGFPLKARVIQEIEDADHLAVDLGAQSADPVDYPDCARTLVAYLRTGVAERGILISGSGAGICVAANRFASIRAATCHDSFSAHQGVEDDGINVLCLGARVIGPELAAELVRAFLGAKFSNAERHCRRVAMSSELQ